MRKRYNFVLAAEQHLVFAHYRAAAYGVHTNLSAARAYHSLSAAYIRFFLLKGGICAVGKHKRRAAGCVLFKVVVLFYNLYVKALAEEGCRLLYQLHQKVYAYRKVCRAEYGDFFGTFGNKGKLFGGVSRCGNHRGHAAACAVFHFIFQAGGGREVNHNVNILLHFGKGLVYLAFKVFALVQIYAANDLGFAVASK